MVGFSEYLDLGDRRQQRVQTVFVLLLLVVKIPTKGEQTLTLCFSVTLPPMYTSKDKIEN